MSFIVVVVWTIFLPLSNVNSFELSDDFIVALNLARKSLTSEILAIAKSVHDAFARRGLNELGDGDQVALVERFNRVLLCHVKSIAEKGRRLKLFLDFFLP